MSCMVLRSMMLLFFFRNLLWGEGTLSSRIGSSFSCRGSSGQEFIISRSSSTTTKGLNCGTFGGSLASAFLASPVFLSATSSSVYLLDLKISLLKLIGEHVLSKLTGCTISTLYTCFSLSTSQPSYKSFYCSCC